MSELSEECVSIDYTSWRGERSTRTIRPVSIRYGATWWHAEPQWLLLAWDVEKGANRDFAMKDIHAWGHGEGGAHEGACLRQ